MNPAQLNATAAAEAIRSGDLTSEELVQACLNRVDEVDQAVAAWAFLDPDHALDQARKADQVRQEGGAMGPLHGLPIGVKDNFDTFDMPTEYGTVLYAGHRPVSDAAAVSLLRAAGGVIMGKTVTTELAVYSPGKTHNPHDPERTPGGSSSGSAAAVASYMVPLAIGTQTNGSIIRPASYCGVYGFKPSHGLISRHRVLTQSRPLDHVGVFARSVEDIALIAEQLMAYDENDQDTRPRARPKLAEVVGQEPPLVPRLAFVKTPVWDQVEADTKNAFVELIEHVKEMAAAQDEDRLGQGAEEVIAEVELPEIFEKAHEWHRAVMEADLARNFAREYRTGKKQLSSALQHMIERGESVRAIDYNRAIDGRAALNNVLGAIFDEYDAILTPAARGEAPVGLESTGSPLFCTIWTLCGTPAISLPLLRGMSGLPIGVQLVGAKGDDARLLRTARWLTRITSE